MLLFLLLLSAGAAAYYIWPAKKLNEDQKIDRLVVFKSKRKMKAYSGAVHIRTYAIALGKNPVGHKQYEGDNRTPEGTYYISARNPNSKFYKNLGISYPNNADKAQADALGKSPGGHIKIHGLRNGKEHRGRFHRWKDWTAGCIAVTNAEIDELYKAVVQDAVIEIHP